MKPEIKRIVVLVILYIGFISLGLPDQVLGVAWPQMRLELLRPLDNAGVLVAIYSLFSGIAGYFSGYFISRYTVPRIVIVSTFLTVVGLLGYGLSHSWLLMLVAAVPFGLGAGAIDSALNNYVAMNYSSKHMNWLHGFWGVGATLGPVILTGVFTMGFSWRVGYLMVASIQFLLVVIFFLTKNIWKVSSIPLAESDDKKEKVNIVSVDTFLSALFFSLYVAVESGIGLWYYSLLVDGRHISAVTAGTLISVYWGSLMAGRFITGALTQYVEDRKIITFGILIVFVSIILLGVHSFKVNFAGLILAGLGLSGLYPCMMNVAHKRFDTKIAQVLIGHQVGAACFGFVIPLPFIGILMQHFGLEILVPVLLCFIIALLGINLRLSRLSCDSSGI